MKLILLKNQTRLFQTITLFVLLLLILSLPILSANASDDYVPLAPITGTTDAGGAGTTLSTYLTGMFKVGIAVAGVLAFLMIVLGGFQYLSTDAITGKEEGKERVMRALGGLVLALVSYIILNTINPKLVALNLDFGPRASGVPALTRPANLVSLFTNPVDLEALRVSARGFISANVNERIQAIADKENAGEELTPAEEEEKIELEIIRQGTVAVNRIELTQANINAELAKPSTPWGRARAARASVEQLRIEVNNEIAAMAASGATVEQMAVVRRKFAATATAVENCIALRANPTSQARADFNGQCVGTTPATFLGVPLQ